MNPSCEKCKFYSKLDSQCRRELKTAFVNMPHVGMSVNAGFPVVRPEWWCGDFEAKLEVV